MTPPPIPTVENPLKVFVWVGKKINTLVSDKMEIIKTMFSQNVSNHISLHFGDGLIGAIKYKRKN